MSLLTNKLSIEDQQELLSDLFSFRVVDAGDENCPVYVIYDEEGYEFYDNDDNCRFHFDTLSGIIEYIGHLKFEYGREKVQRDIRKAIGL